MEEVQHLHGLGVPKATIAKKLGVHRNTVANWLTGANRPMADYKRFAPASEQARGGLSTGSPTVAQTDAEYPTGAEVRGNEGLSA